MRGIEREASGDKAPSEGLPSVTTEESEHVASDPEKASAYMTHSLLSFNEKLERIAELAVVLLIGGMLASHLTSVALWLAPLLFIVMRPTSVLVCLVGSNTPRAERWLISWFGIRGIGWIYYLMYAVQHGLPAPLAERLTPLILSVVAASIVVHGISATPLMEHYYQRRKLAPSLKR